MSSNMSKAVNCLTTKAQKLSKGFHQLLNKSTVLLVDSQNVNKKITDSCGVQDDQLLKNLVKYCNDEERISELLENAELKQTLDEYKAGVDHIMAKYREHCQGNILEEPYNLREKYVAGLQSIVNNLERRIEEMTLIMMFTVGLEEHSSNENQRIIKQLAAENEMMRRKLQISNQFPGKDYLEQNQPAQVDSSTQVDSEEDFPQQLVEHKPLESDSVSISYKEMDSADDSDSDTSDSSSYSFHSFITCYSGESQSTVSEGDQLHMKKAQ